ncbi:hypothetical protein NA57DRAFT_81382 [Rhizodiscina lignyota]|uniref:Uncharacterized protein n=1 Tax=Rhizodiscina lignyota TaxID=1504668 RepID=A0A9P4I1W3_9PEZI|nr:hypothetical protein NA57DRAFT_81382 [Rhizodiscina lignyota]
MAPLGIELSGAPDELIGTPEAKASAVQVMQIDLTKSVLDELLQCTRNGKPPHILFGRNPRLEYGDKTRILEHSSENFRHELYRYEEGEEQEWAFGGLINHSLQLQKLRESSANSDKALENLKSSLAHIQEQRDAEKTIIETTSQAPPSRNNKLPKSKGHLRTPSLLANLQKSSLPNSPSLSALSSPALAPAPTSIPESEAKAMFNALRAPIVHLLAVKPASLDSICKKTRGRLQDVTKVIEQTGKKVNSDSGSATLYELHDRSYKFLDVYKFRYSVEERETAVKNAVRAFDRMRVSREDNLWQMLLPQEERGKGKVLSRLGDLSQGPRNTPMMTAQKIDRKTGLLKKTEVKKERKSAKHDDEEDKAHKSEGGSKLASQEKKERKPREPSTKVPKSKEPRMGRKAERKAELEARPAKASKTNNAQRPAPPASKPKNPSPLSSSPPVNASDFEDSHPVHKRLQAAASPAKKRKADEASDLEDSHLAPKRLQQAAASPAKTAVSVSPAKKRKAEEGDTPNTSTPPIKARKLHPSTAPISKTAASTPNGITPTSTPRVNGHSHGAVKPAITNGMAATTTNGVPATSSSSQSPSPPLTLSWRQQLDLAQKFKRYYERYEKLWHQLADSPTPPSEQAREELMRMHERLGEMKREIAGGRVR